MLYWVPPYSFTWQELSGFIIQGLAAVVIVHKLRRSGFDSCSYIGRSYSTRWPSKQRTHGMIRRWNRYGKSEGEQRPWLATPKKPSTCSSSCLWHSKGEMWSPFKARSLPASTLQQVIILLASSYNNSNNNNNNKFAQSNLGRGRVAALSHTDAVKSPLDTMARPKCAPKSTPFRGPIRKPHYLPHPWNRPKYDAKRHPDPIHHFSTMHWTDRLTDRRTYVRTARQTDRSSTGKFDDYRPLRYESDAA